MNTTRENFFDYASGNPFVECYGDLENMVIRNPHTPSFYASAERSVVSNTKELISEMFGCETDEIIFTSGASESNALALQTPFECSDFCHASIKENPNKVEYSPYKAVSLVDGYMGMLHSVTDATHIDITQGIQEFVNHYKFNELPCCETIAFSGSKIGALQGIGVLIVRRDVKRHLKPLIYGKQQDGLRGGTLNVLGIESLYHALLKVKGGYKDKEEIINANQKLKLYQLGVNVYETINILLLDLSNAEYLKGHDSETIMHDMELNANVICGIGSACDGKSKNTIYEKYFGKDYKILRFSIDRYYENMKAMKEQAIDRIIAELERIKSENGKKEM